MKTTKIFLILSFFLLFLSLPQKASAEQIKTFQALITISKNGTLRVEENILYDFGSLNKHGIFRYIPLSTKLKDNLFRRLKITFLGVNRNGGPEEYSVSNSNDFLSVKIGNKDRLITGSQLYRLVYSVENAIGNYSDHDELFWNTTGNEWKVPILASSVRIGKDFPAEIINTTCYTGVQGSKSRDCKYFNNYFSTTGSLKPSEGLTIAVAFPANTFPKSLLTDKPSESKINLSPGMILLLKILLAVISLFYYILLPLYLLIWYSKTKKKTRFGTPAVNFDLPKDEKGQRLEPALTGTIDTARLDKDDVIGTIFDLAIRKLIKIKEIKKEKILGFGEDKDYLLIKQKDYAKENITNFEKILLERLFKDDNQVSMSTLSKDFFETFKKLSDEIFKTLINRGYYTKNPKTQRGVLLGLGILCFFTFNFILGAILVWFSRIFIGRTAKGEEMDWKIDGLKLFLKSMDRNYQWQAMELAIVEKMIPYAIALGYIDKFMEQLKIIKPDYHPSWYSGNLAFYAVSSSMFRSMSSTIATSAPSSSSGFSSGGFSGGGGGGGGGGSW